MFYKANYGESPSSSQTASALMVTGKELSSEEIEMVRGNICIRYGWSPDIINMLKKALKNGRPRIRAQICQIFTHHAGRYGVVPEMIKAATHDPDEEVRISAINALEDSTNLPAVRHALSVMVDEDESPAVRIRACQAAVEKTKREDAVRIVVKASTDRDENVQRAAQEILDRIPYPFGGKS